ncbi:hypothetical protein [Bacillus sp. REN16]|uniref:hypothetical protein n=1 Tax=Bacillus sp. REN16 TaxID=2887296 RepID=UPI001E627F1E|nr:hypothetical protein [Bacillus sp. REN16]MCC3359139.1 hypothetical protein [Bacillus sp. REN16]
MFRSKLGEEEGRKIRIEIKSRSTKTVLIFLISLFVVLTYGYHRLEKDFVYPIVPVEIKADFLSEAYFSELSEQYDQIRAEHRKWYLFDTSKAISSHAILTQMMQDLKDYENLLSGHKHFDLYFETFDQYVKQLPYLTEEIHYFRNELNRYGEAPEQLEEMIERVACGKWQLFSARYHRYEVSEYDAGYNVKFISANGRFEVVYHAETGQMVNDPVNMGTYNYAPGSLHPWKYYQHHKYDKVPWKKWGNTNQISYKEITKRKSRHGSAEQRNSIEELDNVIKNKMSDSQKCR